MLQVYDADPKKIDLIFPEEASSYLNTIKIFRYYIFEKKMKISDNKEKY